MNYGRLGENENMSSNSTLETNSNNRKKSSSPSMSTSTSILNDLKQLNLLLWKNYLLQKRSIIGTILEILVPALFVIILLPIRTIVRSDYHPDDSVFDEYTIDALPSSLLPPFNYDDDSLSFSSRAGLWTFAYAPNNTDLVNRVMKKVGDTLSMNIVGFENEQLMVDYLDDPVNYKLRLGGASFLSQQVENFTYAIRLSYSPRNSGQTGPFKKDMDWKTKFIYSLFPILGPRERGQEEGGDPGYYREGFISIQKSIDFALIEELGGDKFSSNPLINSLELSLKRFPYPPYNDDKFVVVIAALFPFIIMLTFVFTVIITAKSIVYEKETGLKEAMKLMGMKPWIYWLSWYIKTFALLLPAIIFMSVAFKLKINIKYGGSAAIVDKTDPFMFALFLFLYASSSITFTFLCTTFFKKANSAAAGTGVIWFFTYLPYVFIALRYEKMNLAEKVLALFLNNLAMSEGVQLIGMFEGKGTGIDFHNWTSGLSVDDNFSMFMVMTVMFLNNFTHLTLAYYFESIRPGDHGLAKPWYFPLTSLKRLIVCCCCRFTSRKQSRLETYVNEPINGHDAAKTILNTEDNHMAVHIEDEANYAGKPVGIKITSLTKCFEQFGKVKKAVNDLSLNIYEGQISVLLGHNGAGKSTTISMITGLTEPTNGKILINDIDIVEKTREARKFIGFCPQHNLLFDDMTVYEHLKFFAKLKNNFDEKEIDNMLEIINLADKKHALSKNLSGGMKRKLSVAIAFIGKSSIVILDEPSSGMDPQARHSTWSLLQKFKKERKCTILLTTHFMDEADFLGDRIAIMSRGSLRCCGSPLFLKSKYSSGYNLVLTKRQLDSATANEDESLTNNDDKTNPISSTNEGHNHHTTSYETGNRIRNLIQSILPEAALNENLNSEISFVLPSEKTGKFSELFEKLEENKQYLNIDNIGISISTLEDVFLKIGNTEDCEEEEGDNEVAAAGADEDANNDHPGSLHAAMANGVGQYEPDDHGLWIGSNSNDLVSGFEHIILQFQALLTKRLIHSLRNKTLVIAQIIIPIGVLIINLLSLRYGPIQPEDSPALPIDLIRYSHNYVPFTVVSPNQTSQDIAEFMRQLAGLFAQTVDSRSNSKAFEINRTDVIDLCTDSRDTIEHLISCLGRLNFEYIADTFILGTEFNASIMDRPKIVAHFNNQPFHVPPLALTQVSNALLKFVLNSSNSSILTINHPLPRTAHDELNDLAIKDATGFNVASGISFGFSFLIASFAIFLIKERASNSKHIQYLSGCNSNVFWISAFLWDMLNYFIPLVFVIILLKLFGIKEYVDEGRWVYMFALLFLYGLSHIPQMYLFSYFFSVSATGFASLVAWNILSSQMTLVPVQILSLPQLDLIDVSNMLEWIFLLLFPNFSIGQSLADFYNNYQVARICRNITEYCAFFPNPCCYNYDPTNPNRCGNGTSCFVWTDNFMQWERPGLLRFFVFMPVQFAVQFGLVLIYEAGYIRWVLYRLRRLFSPSAKSTPSLEVNHQQLAIELEYGDISKDEDVSNEETRISELVNSGSHKNESCKEIFIIDRLAKHYAGGFMAVKGISFSLQQSECFGLLGVNGAGKTTTFKMLTGDEIITSGDAYLNHVNLKQDIKKFQSQVGYCPQFDPLIDQMTVLETMKMFAYLRGIKPRLVKQTCLSLISLLDLTEHMTKMCYTLSGGNKRKLAVAVSLIGSPSVVLLDEPTSGMDPRTRRTLWNCLNQIRNHGKSLILTTHAMDETEVLCTNIGIMVNGELKCLGSLQHLKSKYGEGYTLLAKINLASSSSSSNHHTNNNTLTVNVNDDVPSTSTQSNNTTTTTTTLIKDKTDKFVEFVLSRFDRGELKESRDGFVNIHISDNSTRLLSSLFSLVENVKNEFGIEYYVVTQTNLEQIFLNFASKQIQPETRFVKNRKRFFCF